MKTLRLNDRGAEVKQLQQLLTWWGIPTKIDGYFGNETLSSVKRFQTRRQNVVRFASQRLAVDGIVGRQTWAELTKTPVSKINSDTLHPQVYAFLKLIRVAEGTAGEDGYNTIFTGVKFHDFSKHPKLLVCADDLCSDAAGAYQFLSTTWQELAKDLRLNDFSPHSQDLGAIELIRRENAYPSVIEGNLVDALNKTSWIWASLPPSRYNQPTISRAKAISVFEENGGVSWK